MSGLAGNVLALQARRQWLYGLGLMAAAAAVAVAPAALRLSRSLKKLSAIRATYAAKLSWADNQEAMELRVRAQEEAASKLDARLLAAADVAGLTQSIAVAARESRCSVRSIRPAEARVLARADVAGPDEAPGAAQEERRTQFVEWPLSIAVQGDFGAICTFLSRLESGERFLRFTKLALQPADGDREQVVCTVELAGYGLQPAPEEESR